MISDHLTSECQFIIICNNNSTLPSMDMFMIDVTDIPAAQVGDEVILFGKELSVDQVAKWASTIPYEILTGISQRVKRVYFQD